MSRSTCISHPESERFIVIRLWQLEYCTDADGWVDECAAALLSFFEYWHNSKLDTAERNKSANDALEREGKARKYREDTVQWHSNQELEEGLLIFKRSTIQKALKFLEARGCISVFRNPELKYDNTKHFQFYPEALTEWLRNHRSPQDLLKTAGGPTKNSRPTAENNRAPAENSRTIPKTSSQITPENTKTTECAIAKDQAEDVVVVTSLANEFKLNQIQKEKISKYIKERGRGYVQEKASLTRSEKRENAGRYFMGALRDDFQPPKPVPKPSQAGGTIRRADIDWDWKAFLVKSGMLPDLVPERLEEMSDRMFKNYIVTEHRKRLATPR